MTPNPASAGSDRLDVAAKPPEPIQNWLLIFARGFTRPTGTSARAPKFTTPSNPFAPNGLTTLFGCPRGAGGFQKPASGTPAEYPFDSPAAVVNCPTAPRTALSRCPGPSCDHAGRVPFYPNLEVT